MPDTKPYFAPAFDTLGSRQAPDSSLALAAGGMRRAAASSSESDESCFWPRHWRLTLASWLCWVRVLVLVLVPVLVLAAVLAAGC